MILSTASNVMYDSVLKNAGARPADRDSADKRVVSDVKNRVGQIINCVTADGTVRCSKNAGGWPVYAVNQRALTLPANQATVTSSGYTNLEVWLQQMDKSLSGVVAGGQPGRTAGVGSALSGHAQSARRVLHTTQTPTDNSAAAVYLGCTSVREDTWDHARASVLRSY